MRGLEMVAEQVKAKNSRIIIGMDEGWADLPVNEVLRRVEQGRENAIGVKPNGGFWPDGKLAKVTKEIRNNMPEMVIIHDAKRNDIGNTQQNWAKKDQEMFNPHISTINTYMGYEDTTKPFIERGIDVFALAKTSNKDTAFQNMISGGLYNYQQNYLLGREYDPNNIGYVIGSTMGDAMINIRAIEKEHGYNEAWALAPGLGSSGQKGEPESIVPFGGDKTLYPLSRQFAIENPGEEIKLWKDKINATAVKGYSIKSFSQQFIENMIACGIFKVVDSPDESTWFALKAGGVSPIYWDVRNIQWYPALRHQASYLLSQAIKNSKIEYDCVVPVLMGALALGFDTSLLLNSPALTLRDKPKDHGDKQEFVGRPNKGDTALIIEDVFTKGTSTKETVQKIESIGLKVKNATGLVDREQGAKKALIDNNIELLGVITQSNAIDQALGDHPMRSVVYDYLQKQSQK
jgi:orotate phosphoribosyltransferase